VSWRSTAGFIIREEFLFGMHAWRMTQGQRLRDGSGVNHASTRGRIGWFTRPLLWSCKLTASAGLQLLHLLIHTVQS
jgi:hypothetical protein